jgi:hypothetical protein
MGLRRVATTLMAQEPGKEYHPYGGPAQAPAGAKRSLTIHFNQYTM